MRRECAKDAFNFENAVFVRFKRRFYREVRWYALVKRERAEARG